MLSKGWPVFERIIQRGSVLQGLHGGRQTAAAVDKYRGVPLVDGHDGAVTQQAAKVQHLASLGSHGGDHTHGSGLAVHHADGSFVCDQSADDGCTGVAGDDDHVDAHRADGGHGFQLFQREGAGGSPGDPRSIEELFEELDLLIRKLEDGSSSLEDSFRYYEEGMKLVKTCAGKIDRVEKQIVAVNDTGGEYGA